MHPYYHATLLCNVYIKMILVGHVLDIVKLPAITEEDESHIIRSPYRTWVARRKVGEVLHPEREPLPVLEHLKWTLGEYNFAGQYQQSPAPLGSGMVKFKGLGATCPENSLPSLT